MWRWTMLLSYGPSSTKKLEGKFDVDVSRLWEEGLTEPMLSEPWFDLDDFKEALISRRP